ncbi:DMT family transporter (plasmid) [Paroceanicella profunda]|uniref:DMT family transporter n=1 Tax=Paroceanicella profunda TaxID=2579971 RepID=A0A5B8G3C9_9RHOB|nr:DMT family transporter [Paroceanicella profunda]QDL94470.1 DMT family transporter [Paroceanicella profunda]
MTPDWLWIVFTLGAAFSQTFRNALQRGLTGPLGTVGATHVRFLYGLPFALLFFGLILLWVGRLPPLPDLRFAGMVAVGALTQIVATGLMLAAMRKRAFLIVTAYTKCEPVLVILVAWVLVGETVSAAAVAAVALATAGVMTMSWPGREMRGQAWAGPVAFGLMSGGLFAVSAVCFRSAINGLGSGMFLLDASFTLVCSLSFQVLVLSLWLALRDPQVLRALLRNPRQSLPAGFAGAFASQLWFLAFALQSASLVRTAALSEILFAQLLSRRMSAQRLTAREAVGVAMLAAGVAGVLLL